MQLVLVTVTSHANFAQNLSRNNNENMQELNTQPAYAHSTCNGTPDQVMCTVWESLHFDVCTAGRTLLIGRRALNDARQVAAGLRAACHVRLAARRARDSLRWSRGALLLLRGRRRVLALLLRRRRSVALLRGRRRVALLRRLLPLLVRCRRRRAGALISALATTALAAAAAAASVAASVAGPASAARSTAAARAAAAAAAAAPAVPTVGAATVACARSRQASAHPSTGRLQYLPCTQSALL